MHVHSSRGTLEPVEPILRLWHSKWSVASPSRAYHNFHHREKRHAVRYVNVIAAAFVHLSILQNWWRRRGLVRIAVRLFLEANGTSTINLAFKAVVPSKKFLQLTLLELARSSIVKGNFISRFEISPRYEVCKCTIESKIYRRVTRMVGES